MSTQPSQGTDPSSIARGYALGASSIGEALSLAMARMAAEAKGPSEMFEVASSIAGVDKGRMDLREARQVLGSWWMGSDIYAAAADAPSADAEAPKGRWSAFKDAMPWAAPQLDPAAAAPGPDAMRAAGQWSSACDDVLNHAESSLGEAVGRSSESLSAARAFTDRIHASVEARASVGVDGLRAMERLDQEIRGLETALVATRFLAELAMAASSSCARAIDAFDSEPGCARAAGLFQDFQARFAEARRGFAKQAPEIEASMTPEAKALASFAALSAAAGLSAKIAPSTLAPLPKPQAAR